MATAPASYVLCGTPRSGTTLLCEMLTATGVAGQPNSYFGQPYIEEWADAWGVPHPHGVEDAGFDRDYLAAMRRVGSAGTGVFGLRLMWAGVTEAARRLDRALGAERDVAESLEAAFGPTLFVHVSRVDKLAQAVSRVRAEQGGVWHRAADGSILEGAESAHIPSYDGARIGELLRELHEHDAAWFRFFEERRIDPLRLVYEDVAADPQGALGRILAALGLDRAIAARTPVRTAKLSDRDSEAWVGRFRREDRP